jgi:hypothetical protein
MKDMDLVVGSWHCLAEADLRPAALADYAEDGFTHFQTLDRREGGWVPYSRDGNRCALDLCAAAGLRCFVVDARLYRGERPCLPSTAPTEAGSTRPPPTTAATLPSPASEGRFWRALWHALCRSAAFMPASAGEEGAMYVSRLTFATQPGRTQEVEERLRALADLVAQAGGQRPRVLRSHFASLGSPDLVLEEEVPDLATLEREIGDVTARERFQQLASEISGMLVHSSKREIYRVLD